MRGARPERVCGPRKAGVAVFSGSKYTLWLSLRQALTCKNGGASNSVQTAAVSTL